MFNLQWIFFIFASVYFSNGYKKLYLPNIWTAHNSNLNINVPASVPGGIYSDLNKAEVIGDIYYRFNDINYRWVGNYTWIYTTNFDVETNILNKKNVNLVFEGLDTISTIWLNNYEIGTSNNMFIRYVFNIKQHIKTNHNNLTIEFKSPIAESKRLYEIQSKSYPVPPTCPPTAYHGECHVNHIRKMQASFAWDWGPAFPSVGIWKPVYIESYNSVTIQDVTVNITDISDIWNINFYTYFATQSSSQLKGTLVIQITTNIDTVSFKSDVSGNADNNGEYHQQNSLQIPKLKVDLWWPNGYGKQQLYEMKIIFYPKNVAEKVTKNIKIGFRSIELVQKNMTGGLTFYFKVNGIPIFAKGSNWIPANILPEHGANETYIKYLLKSAKNVNMNMLRVWGGGVYESDKFYELADQFGIMIWQDVMFACAMYPVNDEFIMSVQTEIKQQVRRLQHHPSVAVWAGNNENEAALGGNWYGTMKNYDQYKKDYIKLYVDTIRPIILQNDDTRSYVTSSPSNGIKSDEDGYIARNPYDGHYGDTHFYNYLLDGWSSTTFPITRFASEYGYQSLPSYETLMSATNISEDLIFNSEFLNKREHSPGGYFAIRILMNKHFELPSIKKNNFLKTFIYYSQISQAMSIKIETEHYREWRSTVNSDGFGLTMGALYWQLNDVWQAPSWSSIDFNGNWKMLHYYAKNFFSPILVSASINKARELTIHVISDTIFPILNGTITIKTYKWGNLTAIKEERISQIILPGYSNIIKTIWIDKYLMEAGCGEIQYAKSNCFIYLTFENEEKLKISNNFVLPTNLKSIQGLKSPNLTFQISNVKNQENIFNITVSTDTITPFVWLETKFSGKFSENGFLQVTEDKNIEFISESSISLKEFEESLLITSMLSKEHL